MLLRRIAIPAFRRRASASALGGGLLVPHSRRAAFAMAATPPLARKVPRELAQHGDVRVDNYYWLRDDSRSHPDVLAHLRSENLYTATIMSDVKNLEDEIYTEIRARIKEDDIGVPLRKGQYYYYNRTLTGKEYVQHCRRLVPTDAPVTVYDVMPTGPNAPDEHIILDENVKAEGHEYYSIGAFKVSPNGKLVAYAQDTKGDEIYTVYVIDAESGKFVGQPLEGITSDIEWAGDDHLVYITMDAILRPDKVWLHMLESDQSNDICLYHEKDDMFSLGLQTSESKQYLFVESGSKNTSFIFYLDISKQSKELVVLTPRVYGIDTTARHRGNHFYIKRRSEEFYNSELIACPLDNDFQLFENHIAVYERQNGLPKVTAYHLPATGEPIGQLQGGREIDFVDPAYDVEPEQSQFGSSVLRFHYSSMRTPPSVFDYDMDSGVSVLKKIDTMDAINSVKFCCSEAQRLRGVAALLEGKDRVFVMLEDEHLAAAVLQDEGIMAGGRGCSKPARRMVLGGFDASNYVTERKWAAASDGTQIPMTILYRKDRVNLDGSDPMLLYGYGSYEICIDPSFGRSRFSLVDRGFIYVIAHIRGGGEMGRKWYEDGKLLNKRNTFTDFIACAEHLIENKYCSKEKLCINGRSAGGLLMGAVLNMRPDLFKAAVAGVPFVDVLTTMLDPTIPLTTSEWEEWGDPRKEEYYYYMKSYSPVDNVKAQGYPNILVTAGLNDPRVMYSEPAKYVAKLRELKTDDNLLLFKCELGAGHFSKSGRFEKLREDAFTYAFILKALGMAPKAAL
uniref:Prolyl endopeptidase n=1 Tax=Oryza punctata TaxID=4537 RepID=A0A0E0LFZ3_ORYPU